MIINRLKLENWRNYYQEEVVWDESVNLIHGANAQGKTNLLEAISYLGLASSFRAAQDIDLINKQKSYFYLGGEISSDKQGKIEISAAMNRSKQRKWKINSQPKRRLVDIVGVFHTVVFSPEDIYLVKGGPTLRRRWLNRQISQIDPVYCRLLLTYNNILKQRNACLKNWYKTAEEDSIEVWDSQLIEVGSKIAVCRTEIVSKLNEIIDSLHSGLSGGEKLQLAYQSTICGKDQVFDLSEMIFRFKEEIIRLREAERFRGGTLVGPHRDDIRIVLDDLPARDFSSQGQQRTLAVSLKLAELELAYRQKGEYPVLLLDDVLSELDEKRRQRVLELPGITQTFITATGQDIALGRGKKWRVEATDGIGHIK